MHSFEGHLISCLLHLCILFKFFSNSSSAICGAVLFPRHADICPSLLYGNVLVQHGQLWFHLLGSSPLSACLVTSPHSPQMVDDEFVENLLFGLKRYFSLNILLYCFSTSVAFRLRFFKLLVKLFHLSIYLFLYKHSTTVKLLLSFPTSIVYPSKNVRMKNYSRMNVNNSRSRRINKNDIFHIIKRLP